MTELEDDEFDCDPIDGIENIDLVISIDEFMRNVSDATRRPCDAILIVSPRDLPEGSRGSVVETKHGKCLVVAGFGAAPDALQRWLEGGDCDG